MCTAGQSLRNNTDTDTLSSDYSLQFTKTEEYRLVLVTGLNHVIMDALISTWVDT
jgi:hypothetical protein